MIAPGVPGRHFMQVAFIVDDIEAACLEWVRTTGIGPFMIVPHIRLAEYDYRGEPGSGLDFSVAIAQSGGVQIELVQQHDDGPSAYRDTIARGQTGFQHLGIYTDEYDRLYAHYRQQGFAVAAEGVFGTMRFSYIDTSKAIGCMVELIEEDAAETDFFQRIAAAAEGWDGATDPIREGFPA